MKARSAKAKGRKLQNLVTETLREAFPSLDKDDVNSQIMGVSGEDIVMSPLAKKTIKMSFECKNQERLNLWGSLEQAETNCEDRCPVLEFTRNRKPVYAAIPFDELINFPNFVNGEIKALYEWIDNDEKISIEYIGTEENYHPEFNDYENNTIFWKNLEF